MSRGAVNNEPLPAAIPAPAPAPWLIGHPDSRQGRAHRLDLLTLVGERPQTLCGLPIQSEWAALAPGASEECFACTRRAKGGSP